MPLRAFLGITFCFARLQKLANPNFFNANSPSSIQAQLIASIRISPLHDLLGRLLRFAVPIGIVIALAEVAVGLGTILGLWMRAAAAGGMVLAFTLFITVSFHSSPFYTGADIVFVFAWIPLVLAGSGGVLSLDGVIAARVAHEHGLGPPTMVPVQFALVQQICGDYDNDSCTAREGRRCDVYRCPFLSADPAGRGGTVVEGGLRGVDRRSIVLGGAAAVAVAVVGGTATGLGWAVGGAKSPSDQSARWLLFAKVARALQVPVPRRPHRRPRHRRHPRPRRPPRRRLSLRSPQHRRGPRLAGPARCRSAGRRVSAIRRRVTLASSFSSPKIASSPMTPSAQSGIPQPPTSLCAHATGPSSPRAPALS